MSRDSGRVPLSPQLAFSSFKVPSLKGKAATAPPASAAGPPFTAPTAPRGGCSGAERESAGGSKRTADGEVDRRVSHRRRQSMAPASGPAPAPFVPAPPPPPPAGPEPGHLGASGLPPAGGHRAVAQQVAQLLGLADTLLPVEEEEEEEGVPRESLRDALKASWGGRSYLERLEAMHSPAAPAPRGLPVDESPLSRAAAAAAALDDCAFLPAAPRPMLPPSLLAAAVPSPSAPPTKGFGKPPIAQPARAPVTTEELARLQAQLAESQASLGQEVALRRAAEAQSEAARKDAAAQRARADALVRAVPELLRELLAELSAAVSGVEASIVLRLRNLLDA